MKATKINTEGITFDDGTTITHFHYQECCENVYADWEQIDDDFKNKEIDKIKIEGVPGSGFRINGYFVPCYNRQNGYYGSDIELIITKQKKINISKFVKQDIS